MKCKVFLDLVQFQCGHPKFWILATSIILFAGATDLFVTVQIVTTSRLKKLRDSDDMVNMEEALIQGVLQIKDITNM